MLTGSGTSVGVKPFKRAEQPLFEGISRNGAIIKALEDAKGQVGGSAFLSACPWGSGDAPWNSFVTRTKLRQFANLPQYPETPAGECDESRYRTSGRITLFAIVLFGTTIASCQNASPRRQTIILGASIEDARTGAELPGTQVILQFNGDTPPQTTYSNTKGLYSFSVTAATGLKGATIAAATPNYRRRILTTPPPAFSISSISSSNPRPHQPS